MTVIVIRHHCVVAVSWHRLQYDVDRHINVVVRQANLFNDFLSAFEEPLRSAKDFWQKMGALCGATYRVLLEQQKAHPEWIVVQHEALCANPVHGYREIFNGLDLGWTEWTDKELERTTTRRSKEPYEVGRVLSLEPDKWKQELEVQQIEQIRRFVQPFRISYYSDWSSAVAGAGTDQC